MSQNTSKALVLTTASAALERTVKPKPTRAEIIDALTELEVARIHEEQQKARHDKAALCEEINADLAKIVRKMGKALIVESFYAYAFKDELSSCTVKIDVVNLVTPALAEKIARHNKMPTTFKEVDEKNIRRRIAEGLKGIRSREERVDELLIDPESRNVLAAMLETINGPKQAAA